MGWIDSGEYKGGKLWFFSFSFIISFFSFQIYTILYGNKYKLKYNESNLFFFTFDQILFDFLKSLYMVLVFTKYV